MLSKLNLKLQVIIVIMIQFITYILQHLSTGCLVQCHVYFSLLFRTKWQFLVSYRSLMGKVFVCLVYGPQHKILLHAITLVSRKMVLHPMAISSSVVRPQKFDPLWGAHHTEPLSTLIP